MVDRGEDEIVFLADADDLVDFVREEVGDAEPFEGALVVELLDAAEGFLPGDAAVWRVEVIDVDLDDRDG